MVSASLIALALIRSQAVLIAGARHVADHIQPSNKQTGPRYSLSGAQRIYGYTRIALAAIFIFVYFCLFGPARIRIILRQRAMRRAEFRAQDLERQEQVERAEQHALLMVKKHQ